MKPVENISSLTFNYELEPFAKLTVFTHCKDILEQVRLVSSEFRKAEVLTVVKGLRDCATIHLSGENVFEEIQQYQDMGLVVYMLEKSRKFEGWANKFYPPRPGEPYTIFCVVARDVEHAKKFMEAYRQRPVDHRTIGKLLGYPDCCVEFFVKVWSRGFYDPIFQIAENTKDAERVDKYKIKVKFYPEVNVMLRYFGIRAIPHLPCSFQCEASREFARAFLNFIEHKDVLVKLLSTKVVWNAYKGIAIVKTDCLYGIANSMVYIHPHEVIGEPLES